MLCRLLQPYAHTCGWTPRWLPTQFYFEWLISRTHWNRTDACLPSTRKLDAERIHQLFHKVGLALPHFEPNVTYSRHFFRALFQLIAVDKGLAKRGPARETKMVIGALPKQAYESFPAYAAACLNKLGFDSGAVTTAEATWYAKEYGQYEDRIRIAWTLSAILAPLLES